MRSKKGMGIEALVALVMLIAATLFLLIYYLKVVDKYDTYSDREVCRESVLAQSISTYVEGSGDLISLNCPTSNIQFFKDHVERNGKSMAVKDPETNDLTKKFSSLNKGIVNQVVAEEIRWCWYQFLEGQKELFTRNLVGAGLLNGGDEPKFCYICDEIYFDGSLGSVDFGSAKEYMMKTPIPGIDVKYYDYIFNNPASKCGHDFAEVAECRTFSSQQSVCDDLEEKAKNTPCWEAFFEKYIGKKREFKDQESFYESDGYVKLQANGSYVITFIRVGKPSKLFNTKLSNVVNILRSETLPGVCDTWVRGGQK